MSSHSKFRLLRLAIIVGLTLGCGGGESTGPSNVAVASIALTPKEASIGIGANAAIDAIVVTSTGDTVPPNGVTWSSSDVAVARVSSAGVVTAVAVGTARIAATVQGRSATATVRVVPTGVAALELSPLQLRLAEGAKQSVTVRVLDAYGTALNGRAVQWRSGDATVATVSPTGVVTAVGPGSTTILATSEGRSASMAVNVTAVSVASVSITPSTATVQVGSNRQLSADVRDASGTIMSGRAVAWSTTTPSIVSISANGLVVGVAPGTGVITASSGGKSATATVTVEALPSPVVVGRVVLTPSAATLKSAGTDARAVQLTAQAFRQQGAEWIVIPDATFSYTSTNTAVASVSGAGLVTALAPGRTTIVATSGSQFATAEVVVESPVPPTVIGRVTVSPTTVELKATGPSNRTVQLLASAYTREDEEDDWELVPDATFTWVSSNPAVATVSPSGLVTALSVGSTYITVTSGSRSATAQIVVNKR